jgi:ribonuclease J
VNGVIEILPLGGLGEFGTNCLCLRHGDEMLLVDVGMGFPEETAYGVDVSVPDFDFLEEYRDQILAVVLTHGHEDHLGALPYLLKKFNVPVYCSHFTAGLAESKLEEHDLTDSVLMHRVEPRDTVEIGESFSVEFIRVSHSLVDCFALAITTPVGTIIHTGDYKVDETPVIGEPIDLRTLRRYGQQGVLALTSDSTNATVPGRTPSERAVIPAFEEIFEEAEGRIFVATFSSSIHRLQIVLDVAQQFDRKVCVLGRSMLKNVEIAERLGYLDVHDMLVPLNEAKRLDDDRIVYLVTGSQGEARAALSQIATQSYKGLTVREGDTVVLSARIIPGNERAISRLIGEIYKRGGKIIDEKRRLVHVSGHASQEDIRIMTEAVRPRFVIPVHGEYRMLYRHKEFLRNHVDIPEDRIVLIENGDVLELEEDRATIVDKREVGRTFIDDSGFEEIDRETVKERRQLAYDGVITPVVTLNEETGELELPPEIVTRGVLGMENGGDGALVRDMQRVVVEAVEGASRDELRDTTLLKERVRVELKRYVQKQTGSRPVIVPVVVQI